MLFWIIYLSVIGHTLCNRDSAFIDDDSFDEAKNSGNSFAVYLYSNTVDNTLTQNVINSIQLSKDDLVSVDIIVGILDCASSKLPICKKPETLNHMLLYKFGVVISTLTTENVQTVLDVQAYLKHYLLLDHMKKINGSEEWAEAQMNYAGQSDLMLYYIPGLGTIEHLRMVNSALTLPSHLMILYTFDQELSEDGNSAWYIGCLMAETNECEVTFSTKHLDSKDFTKYVSNSALVTVMAPDNEDVDILKNLVNKGNDVLVLIAGKGKFSTAISLARRVTEKMGGAIRALVIDGLVTMHVTIKSRVEDNKVFALVSPGKEGKPLHRDIGFLESEELEDLIDDVHQTLSNQDETLSDEDEKSTPEQEGDDGRPEDVLDDPIAFSLHYTSHVKDLYYFDYKTIPRLTDITYKKVTRGMEYAVILFTLEFNQKALAALVNFVEIHNAYKLKTKSPMYRVECYNWPDICAEANVYTSPRMFFYPPGTTESFEYTGMWDKIKMKDAILRYSNPSVIVVQKKEDILPYIPITFRSVVGLFETDDGTTEFREAGEKLRKDYQFIEVHGRELATFIAEQYEVEYEHRRLLAFEHSFPKHRLGTFNNAQDIMDFCDKEFAGPELQEMSIYSFVDVLKDEKPLFIYFWDKTNGNDFTRNTELKNVIQDIASREILTDNVMFTWMDSSQGTTGEFVLGRYNYRSRLAAPIVAFFDKKGSVMLRSCSSEECRNTTLAMWIRDCLEGKVDVTYSLSTEEWKPRLEGYDFLEIMKEEGTYPEDDFQRRSQANDEDSTTPTSRGGEGRIKHKKDDINEETGEKEMKKPLVESEKHPNHSEL